MSEWSLDSSADRSDSTGSRCGDAERLWRQRQVRDRRNHNIQAKSLQPVDGIKHEWVICIISILYVYCMYVVCVLSVCYMCAIGLLYVNSKCMICSNM